MPEKPKRKYVRFSSDTKAIALVGFKDKGGSKQTQAALIINESFSGCCLGMLQNENLKIGSPYVVKVGKLDPLKAVLRWKRTYNDVICEIGFEYLEHK